MRKPLPSRGVLIFSAACLVCLFAATTTLSGHQDEVHGKRYAVLTDWTTHHVLYPLYGSPERMALAGRDPRSTFSWLRYDPDAPHWRGRRHHEKFPRASIATGASASVAGGPQRTCTPRSLPSISQPRRSCTNDYIVYPVNTAGSIDDRQTSWRSTICTAARPAARAFAIARHHRRTTTESRQPYCGHTT